MSLKTNHRAHELIRKVFTEVINQCRSSVVSLLIVMKTDVFS